MSIMETKGAFGVTFFTCLLSMVLVYGQDTCPPDDEKACENQPNGGSSCSTYYYYDMRMNFQDAKAYCEKNGQRLVEFKTDEKHNRLLQAVKNLPRETMVYFGANDLQSEGRFIWNSDGSYVSFRKSWWQSYEPNNFHEEDCLAMKQPGLINDVKCRKKLTFFCESSI